MSTPESSRLRAQYVPANADAPSEALHPHDPHGFIATLDRIGKGAAADGQPWPERHQMPGRRMALADADCALGRAARGAGNAAGCRARTPERARGGIRGRPRDGGPDDGQSVAGRTGQRTHAAGRVIRGTTLTAAPGTARRCRARHITRRARCLPSTRHPAVAGAVRSAHAVPPSARPATTHGSAR